MKLLILIVTIGMVGCTSGRVYFGYERVDKIERQERTVDKPWKCVFMNCKGESDDK